MKKILSLLCIFAMMFSFVATVNAAADNSVYLTYAIVDNTLTLDVNIKGTGYFTASTYYDVANLVTAGAVYKSSENFVSTSNVANFKNNMLATNGNWPDTQNGEFKMATYIFDITNVDAGSITIAPAADSNRTRFSVADKATNKLSFTQESLTIVIEGGDDKGYEDLTAEVDVVTSEYLDIENEIKTDWQVGTGFYAKFTTPAVALDSMKWSAKLDGTKKYSVAYPLSTLGIDPETEVVLYSTYTNGAWEGNTFGKTDKSYVVTEPGIIVKDTEGKFYASAKAIAE